MVRCCCGVAVLACGLAVAACASVRPTPTPVLTFVTHGECANTSVMRANLDAALRKVGLPTAYAIVNLDTLPPTDVRTGYPTPTVLYLNRDIFGMPEPVPPIPEAT